MSNRNFLYVLYLIGKYYNQYVLTMFDEGTVTFRTPDFDATFSARNTDFLFASRTFINMKCPHLLELVFPVSPCTADSGSFFQKVLVFCGTLVDIFRKHPKIGITQKDKCYEVEHTFPNEHINQITD